MEHLNRQWKILSLVSLVDAWEKNPVGAHSHRIVDLETLILFLWITPDKWVRFIRTLQWVPTRDLQDVL